MCWGSTTINLGCFTPLHNCSTVSLDTARSPSKRSRFAIGLCAGLDYTTTRLVWPGACLKRSPSMLTQMTDLVLEMSPRSRNGKLCSTSSATSTTTVTTACSHLTQTVPELSETNLASTTQPMPSGRNVLRLTSGKLTKTSWTSTTTPSKELTQTSHLTNADESTQKSENPLTTLYKRISRTMTNLNNVTLRPEFLHSVNLTDSNQTPQWTNHQLLYRTILKSSSCSVRFTLSQNFLLKESNLLTTKLTFFWVPKQRPIFCTFVTRVLSQRRTGYQTQKCRTSCLVCTRANKSTSSRPAGSSDWKWESFWTNPTHNATQRALMRTDHAEKAVQSCQQDSLKSY